MKANEENLLKFLDGTKQFMLPIYQRRYSWEKEQCDQLWDDVLRVGQNENIKSHFLGSIVSREEVSTRVQRLLVIDGQQRLTTLSLLLSVLDRAIEAEDADFPISRNQIEGYYLFNEKEDGELRYKQLLTEHDRDALTELLEEGDTSDATSLLVDNYRGFEDRLKNADLEVVYKGIQKLMIVSIALESGSDEPQLIFESLNSTGLALSQADLIRNYVLMGQEHNVQTRLYQTYWYPMEQRFGDEYSKRFNLFIRDYLTLKTGQIPNKGKIYESFKRYVDDKRHPEALEKEIGEIARNSEHYVRIVLLQEPDRDLRACFKDIKTLGVEVAYPFLLGVYGDYAEKRLQKEEVIETLRLVESYVFRRTVCDIPRNTLNKTFASMMGRVNKDKYLQSLKTVFSRMTGRQLFPTDKEFRREFQSRNIYDLDTCNYLLDKLENHERSKELVPVGDHAYTTEHVMPQTLTDEWQEELGDNWAEVHETYLHTIGNLTLTGYNQKLGNASFREKQEMTGGFRDSPLRLNASLRKVERWDEDAIVKRAEVLAEKACKIWPDHGVDRETQQGRSSGWRLSDHRHLNGKMLDLFEQLQRCILSLDTRVRRQINKYTIVYKVHRMFVDIEPQASQLRLSLNIPFPEIDDPRGLCRDVTHVGHLGLGDVDVRISSVGELDDVMSLIRKAYEKQISVET